MSRRNIRNRTRNKTKLIDNKCDCPPHPTTLTGPGRCPPTPLTMGGNPKPAVEHEIVANRDPELATAWTKHKAITNYENFYNTGVDMGRGYITSIATVANSSLGIDGWALFDVGLAEESSGAEDVAGGSAAISLVLPGSAWYPPAQTSLTTSIVGGGGLGSNIYF